MSEIVKRFDEDTKQEVIYKEPEPNFDDLTPRTAKKNIGGTVYIIRQASAGIGRRYRNAQSAAIKLSDAKVSGLGDVVYADLLLASLCCEEEGTGKHPTVEVIENNWTDDAAQWVVAKIKELSPSLETKVTVQQLDKQIAKLKRQRAKLLDEPEDDGDLGKGSLGSGTSS